MYGYFNLVLIQKINNIAINFPSILYIFFVSPEDDQVGRNMLS